jgi:hypothetical protein
MFIPANQQAITMRRTTLRVDLLVVYILVLEVKYGLGR